jgi:hypothetical protein
MSMGGPGMGGFGGMPMNGGMNGMGGGGQMMPMPNEGFNGMGGGMSGGNNGGFENGPYSPYNGKRK